MAYELTSNNDEILMHPYVLDISHFWCNILQCTYISGRISPACYVSRGRDFVRDRLLGSFTSTCRLTPNVFVVQKCLRARLSFRAIRRRFCPRRGPERTIGDGIRSTCGPFSSAVAWWAKLKAPRTWRLETPSWCAAFTAPEKQTGRMRRIWNVEGMEFVCLNL